ncbi:hypothetical protein [Segniliparus rugosus]|uniref:Uncharacterized protein n=1 Tax=Segniliparus rugosus (strain ATCC BAA-974 / DSM 45345 / CCUG 50838 / CIP 108380 / JCM 13579 / CDC 945) TaxID=679197 RepID=E5XLY7_SEGRC|nr:hypothetical protein [Segniliparus rugosus]EFV14633.2 hypothetical protein HMPREF9336_00506 [Segniliparus rugosus ATCC BAA-974]
MPSSTLKVRFFAAAAAVFTAPLTLVPADLAFAETAVHDVEYSVEASSGGGTMSVRYATDPHDHSDPTEKHFAQDVVGLPWTTSLRIGEEEYRAGSTVPDSKPFKGLDLGLTVTAEGTALNEGLTDGSGKLSGQQAWDAWTGGQEFQNFYTCRITVDGEVVAEQTMKGLCSVQYKKRSRTAP